MYVLYVLLVVVVGVGGGGRTVSCLEMFLILVRSPNIWFTTQWTVSSLSSSAVLLTVKVLLTESSLDVTQKAWSLQSRYSIPPISQEILLILVPLARQVKFAVSPMATVWLWPSCVTMSGSVGRGEKLQIVNLSYFSEVLKLCTNSSCLLGTKLACENSLENTPTVYLLPHSRVVAMAIIVFCHTTQQSGDC